MGGNKWGRKRSSSLAKQRKSPKDRRSIFAAMGGRFLFALFSLCSLGFLSAQKPQYHVDLRLDDDLHRLEGRVQLDWDLKLDSLPEKIWLEFWPLAFSSNESVLAQQWLENQQTQFHFSDDDEKLQLESLVIHNYSQENVIPFEHGRSPELLWIYRDSLKGENLNLSIRFVLLLPEEGWDDFGWRKDGLILNHCYVRFASFDGENFQPSAWLQQSDRNEQAESIMLSLDLPAHYYPITSLQESGEIRLGSTFDNSDFTFLGQRQYYQYSSFSSSGDLPLFVSKIARPMPRKHLNIRPIWNIREQTSPQSEELVDRIIRMQDWLDKTYQIKDSLQWTMIFTEENLPEEASAGLLFSGTRKPGPYTELALARRYFRSICSRYSQGAESPWISSGLASYMAYAYIENQYPDQSLSGPFENSLIARFFKVDELPITYGNQLLYLYLARQGLDQSVSDSAEAFTRGTYAAQLEAKTVMQLNYLHDYLGDRRFRAAISQYLQSARTAKSFRSTVEKASPYKPVDWFFDQMQEGDQPLDIRLHKTENCPSLFVTTTSARKGSSLPYPISAYIQDSLVMTEWFAPHEKKQGKNFYKADYDKVVVADPLRYPDLFGKNNIQKTKGLFKKGKPLEFQLYTSLENPNKNQVYWLPSVSYNAYDELLVGLSFFNTTIIPKKFEYRLGPEFSTGTGELTGYGYLGVNFPLFEGPIRLISSGVYYRRYHYAPDLAYNRVSPAITFHFRKSNPRSLYIRNLRLRNVYVDLELAAGETGQVGESGYSVFNARYKSEYTHILRPHTLRADFQIGDLFSKLSIEWDQRWMLPNRKWMIFRVFGGWMPYNNNSVDVNLFDFGLSGTQDYLFDYSFIGRSDETGIWSQQFFVSDGGFRAQTRAFGRNHILAANLSVPVYSVLGLYGDLGTIGGPVEWGYGVRIALFTDFLEWYFPIQSRNINHTQEANYIGQTRFVLNLNLDAIINRLRRGFY